MAATSAANAVQSVIADKGEMNMEMNVKPIPQVVVDEKVHDAPKHPNVTAFCRSLKEQGIEFQIIPLAKATSNTET
jgi:hypothetical protein